jgi:hypothetical protein
MKKILFVPQISNRSYTTGKWILMKDAHIKVIKNQMQVLNRFEEFKFLIILPPLEQIEDITCYKELFYEEFFSTIDLTVVIMNACKNVAYNRFHFDMNELLTDKVFILDVDYVITDVPETARNFKMFFSLNKKFPKLIVNVHYIDIYLENQITPGESNYFWRQLDGIICADKVTFFTRQMLKDYFEYAAGLVDINLIESLKRKCSVQDYMIISEYEMKLHRKPKAENKIIFFISRCSDDKRTKWKEFITIMKELRKQRQDFEVFIANPTQIDNQLIRNETENADYFRIPEIPLTRKEYIELLWQSHCVPLFYDIGNNISIGFYEAMFCENVPVQLGVDFDNMDKDNLLKAFNVALDASPEASRAIWEQIIERHSCERNAERFYKELL